MPLLHNLCALRCLKKTLSFNIWVRNHLFLKNYMLLQLVTKCVILSLSSPLLVTKKVLMLTIILCNYQYCPVPLNTIPTDSCSGSCWNVQEYMSSCKWSCISVLLLNHSMPLNPCSTLVRYPFMAKSKLDKISVQFDIAACFEITWHCSVLFRF